MTSPRSTLFSRLRHWAGATLAMALGAGLAMPASAASEPPTEPLLRIEAGMHTASVKRISVDSAGRWAVTASDDKTVRVWELATARQLQVLRLPIGAGNEGKLFSVAISPDGSTIAAGGWTGYEWKGEHHIYLFDRASGRLIRRLPNVPNVIVHLAFSPNGQWLSASIGGKNGIRVWDWRAGTPALSSGDYGDQGYGHSWAMDNRLVATSYDGQLRLYRVAPGALTRLAQVEAPGGKRPSGISFSPDGSRVAVGYIDSARVDVLDGQNLAFLFSPDLRNVDKNLGTVAWSADGRTLAATGSWTAGSRRQVRRWPDGGRGAPQDSGVANDTVLDITALPQGGWLVAAAGPVWGYLQPDGRWNPLGTGPSADLRGSRERNFLLADGGKSLQFGYEEWGKPPHVFSLAERRLAPGTLDQGVAPRTEGLDIRNWINRTDPSVRGTALKMESYETARGLAIAPGNQSFVLAADWNIRHFNLDGSLRWGIQAPGIGWGTNIVADGPRAGQLMVATYGDGTIRWHRMSDGKELLAFFPHADRKRWVLWTPSGYYDASPGAEELIGWHLNRGMDQTADFFPASRFRNKFYRPDVIDRILDTLSEDEAVQQADLATNRRAEATVSVAQVLPPVVEVMTSRDLSTSSNQVTLRVRGRTTADAPVTAWRVRVNGQPVQDARGLGRQDAAPGQPPAGANERDLVVPIPAQDSEIQVFAENRNGVSTAATVRVKWAGTAPAPAVQAGGFSIQPKLYVLAVGVAAYQHKDIAKLGLPAKDARDFAAAMQRQQGRLYRQVEVKVLTDAQAGRDDIVDGLEWLQKQVTQHDVGMIFIAGHGVNDPTLGYTYLPVNADPDRLRRTGVPMDEFKRTLAALPGKAIFFFDTCHSGNVLGNKTRAGPNDVSGVINELASAENGVVVFSSSTGRQLSYEDPAWGNGAFTKALVEGLDGKADYQKNGRITHKMLDLYISERVKSLTGGKQSPVTQAPGGVPDFPVASSRQ